MVTALVHSPPAAVPGWCDVGDRRAGDDSRPQYLVRRRAAGHRHPHRLVDPDQGPALFVRTPEAAPGFFLEGFRYEQLFYLYAAISLFLGSYLTYSGVRSR